MTPQQIVDAFTARAAAMPATTRFHYGRLQDRSVSLVEKRPPLVWLNTDRLLRFTVSEGFRTYDVEFRAITVAGNAETAIESGRLLVAAETLATLFLTGLVLGGQRQGGVSYSPFYAEDAESFTGMQVRFSLLARMPC